MVDVGAKKITARRARARALVRMKSTTRAAIETDENPKGAVLAVARIAGIQAAKRTGDLIPLCHPIGLDVVDIDFRWVDDESTSAANEALLEITAEARVQARTGVEMESLVAATTAALTVYDMCKAADRGLTIERVELVEKEGGKSGSWKRDS